MDKSRLLEVALVGINLQRQQLDRDEADIRRQLGTSGIAKSTTKKRFISEDGRRRISESQKKRWALRHRSKSKSTAKTKPPTK